MVARRVLGVLAALVATVTGFTLLGCSLPGGLQLSSDMLPQFKQASVSEARQNLMDGAASSAAKVATKKQGTLVVGIYQDEAAPLALINEGRLSGMDRDIASALAYQLGDRVSFKSITSAQSALAGSCDIVMGVSEPSDGVSIVGQYAQCGCGFFHVGDQGLAKVSDLSGKRVAVQTASASAKALAATGLDMKVRGCSNLTEAFDLLVKGEADYVLCDSYLGAYVAKSLDNVSFAGMLAAPKAIGIGVSSSSPDLQTSVAKALSTLENNGVLDLIRLQWVGELPVLDASQQVADIPEASSQSDDASQDQGDDTASSDGSAASETSGNEGDGTTAGSNAVTSME